VLKYADPAEIAGEVPPRTARPAEGGETVPGALGTRERERESLFSHLFSNYAATQRATCRRWPTVTVITTGVPSFHSP